MNATALNFLDDVLGETPGVVELRALPSKAQGFFALDDDEGIDGWVAARERENVYFGVAARRDASSGALANCVSLGALFIDIDYKMIGEADARDRLTRFALPPSGVVTSGGGLHVYWRLREPLTLPDDAATATALLRRLAHHLGGDLASAEPARILRVPGTFNHKYPRPRPVRIESWNADALYNASDFDIVPAEPAPANGTGRPTVVPEQIVDGTRNSVMFALARSLRIKGLSPGATLRALETENAEKCTPPLPADELADILQHAYTEADRPDFQPPPTVAETAKETDATAAVLTTVTDTALGIRFTREHGADVHYVPAWKAWVSWDGRLWLRDDLTQTLMMQKAKLTATAVMTEAVASVDPKRIRAAAYALSEPGLRRMLLCAQSEPGIALAAAAFDADPDLLNTPSGIVDLRHGTLGPHRRDALCSKMTAAPYDPTATDPTWTRFLERVFPEPATRAWSQRLFGYTTTGLTTEEVAVLVHGPTASGKTTLTESVRRILGDYATTAAFETFVRRRDHQGGAPREDLARLAGARLVVVGEVQDKALSGVVKLVSGGDTIAARKLYENTIEMIPRYTVVFVGNHRPRVPADDTAFWRRMRELPMTAAIALEERDPDVKRVLTDPTAAGPAILRWIIEGAVAWYRDRLGTAPAIEAATADYRASQDVVGRFIADVCILAADARISRKELRAELQRWGAEEGVERLPDAITVGAWLRAHGITDHKRGERFWHGLRLRMASDPDPEPSGVLVRVQPW